MKIIQLSLEDVPLVTKGCPKELVDELIEELDKAEKTNCVIYVRYGPMFLQRLRVDKYFLSDPTVLPMLLDEEMWEHQEPNVIDRKAEH